MCEQARGPGRHARFSRGLTATASVCVDRSNRPCGSTCSRRQDGFSTQPISQKTCSHRCLSSTVSLFFLKLLEAESQFLCHTYAVCISELP